MRKIVVGAFVLALLMSCQAWADVRITEENFPDENFRDYVSGEFDSDGDGVLSDSEIASVSSINVRSLGIGSMRGIEYFTELKELDCSNNFLAGLEVPDSVVSASLNPQTVYYGGYTPSFLADYPYRFDLGRIITSTSSATNINAWNESGNQIRITTGGV
ncbi:MAG: hypothetical protein IJS28_03580 [Synergistaceae bacterium]|nr:hypothetical protein [Synergistaceae bacterium]